jgi:N-formylmaleamate deformylase
MELINTLDIPSLLVIGGDGAVISPLVAEELARLNQCLEIVQIREAGHGIPYDQPDRFSALVKVFLQSVNA